MIARSRGCKVIAVDPHEQALEHAVEFGEAGATVCVFMLNVEQVRLVYPPA